MTATVAVDLEDVPADAERVAAAAVDARHFDRVVVRFLLHERTNVSYNLEEMIRLTEAIEAQDGELLPETCGPRSVTMRSSTGRTETAPLAYCGNDVLFDIPYTSFVDESPRAITVCAVDDMVGAWPRFQER